MGFSSPIVVWFYAYAPSSTTRERTVALGRRLKLHYPSWPGLTRPRFFPTPAILRLLRHPAGVFFPVVCQRVFPWRNRDKSSGWFRPCCGGASVAPLRSLCPSIVRRRQPPALRLP